MFELLNPTISIATTTLLCWSGFRAWRAQNRFLKWGGAALTALLSLVAASVSVLLILGLLRLHARSAPPVDLKVVDTPEQIRRGQAIADSFCGSCHSFTGTLTGGRDLGEDFPVHIGSFVSANLTPTGQLARWSDGDIFRAIRNGVDPDGRWLMVMSYTNSGKLSDDDTRAVIAYLRSLPAAGQPTDGTLDHLNLLGLAMLGAGQLPTGKPVSRGVITAPPKAPNFDYGEYVLSYQDCRECHGKDLTGGVPGQLGPLGPDLSLVKTWTFEQFAATLRTGVDPNGHELGKQMPWQPIGRMDDDALRAVYEYLAHLPNS
jgi:mono/diheme cytochrome c family protein